MKFILLPATAMMTIAVISFFVIELRKCLKDRDASMTAGFAVIASAMFGLISMLWVVALDISGIVNLL